ncbi:MAG: hypothetical protein JWP01_2824 [Myxococcales bacterium]|nr:hypothetical protein [Myxococcales bacterium]
MVVVLIAANFIVVFPLHDPPGVMIRRHGTILVATDFSAGAARALERATRLPLADPAKLVLVHVLPADAKSSAQADAEELLAQTLTTVPRSPDLEISSEVASGTPFEAIIKHARSLEADLVVMGRHGKRRIHDLLIGSTVHRTVRYGDTPVLVVNAEVTGPYRRPVIALELDDVSRRIVELGLSVLPSEIGEVDVVHANELPATELQLIASTGFEDDHDVGARRFLEDVLHSTGVAGSPWRITIRRADARIAILNETVSYQADLVVLGTHGRSGLAHVAAGSVAEFVLGEARCDVLVTRPTRFTFAMP